MNKDMIMTLIDENGNQVEFELLDIIGYNNSTYAVFYPTAKDDTEVLILRVEDIPGTDNANYIVEKDENIVKEVYKQFKEKYTGRILFPDSIE